uniref:OmpA family protein n=1 Tax=Crenothrix polyspora TaxID=360316 RepID=UPI0011788245
MIRTVWAIQLIGLVSILLLLTVTLPRYAQILPYSIASHAQQQLHEQGMQWVAVRIRQPNSRGVVVSGNAANADEQQKAINTTQSLWYVQQAEDATNPRIIEPYTMHIQWDGNKLSLNGYVNSDKAKAELAEKIQSTFGSATNLTALQNGVGAPTGWEQLIGHIVLKEIKPLKLASVRMIDRTVHFSGKAATSKEVEGLKKSLEPFKTQGYNILVNMAALDNAAVVCQREFNRLLSQDKIMFKSGGASIDSKSDALLQDLADTAIFCADSVVLISGHTDDIGNEEDNLRLSEQRAKAVKGWLFNQGGV